MAANVSDKDWDSYFVSIKLVCPWSGMYYKKNMIDFRPWRGANNITELGDYVARVWIHKHASGRRLCSIHNRMNEIREDEEWLYRHPQYKGDSTPLPVLLQQNLRILNKARGIKDV